VTPIWGGCTDTSRSNGGYLFNIGRAPVSWSSKRQPTSALSSVEAEYYAETQAAKEAIYLRGLLSELGYAKGGSTATSISVENGCRGLTPDPHDLNSVESMDWWLKPRRSK
jgi:hypothetical protein